MSDVRVSCEEVYYDPDDDCGQYICGITQRNCYFEHCDTCEEYENFVKFLETQETLENDNKESKCDK